MTRSIGALFALVLPLAALLSLGCATSFHGSAHFPGGPRGCRAHCGSQQMRMAQYVYAGEYSSACVCEPVSTASASAPRGTSTSSVAAAAGVMAQMRQAQQQQQASR